MTQLLSHIGKLKNLNVGRVCFHEPLKNHCTWKIGGLADALVEPENFEQLTVLRRYLYDHQIASITIGEGSNLLFDNQGFRGVAIKMARLFSAVEIEGNTVRVQTGASVARLARQCGQAGLSGIEHVVGIPGTLGGLLAMNGGSQQNSIGDVVCSVEAIDIKGDVHTFNRDECEFAYRKSIFQDSYWLIVQAVLELKDKDPKVIHTCMLDILRQRRRKFPRRLPNCGSVFLSTSKMYETIGPPGKVIEEAGLKGLTVGGAQVSHQHANFIINTGDATSNDVCRLVKKIRETIHQETGVWLKCEARKILPLGEVYPLDFEPFPKGLLSCFTGDINARSSESYSLGDLLRKIVFNSWYRTVVYYRIVMWFRRKRFCCTMCRFIAALIITRLSRVPGIEFRNIHEIGAGFLMPHPHDIVLGRDCKIGRNVTIYNGVTIGAKNIELEEKGTDWKKERYPHIKDGVTIFTGAKIIGPIVIGENSTIGANAVVMKSFPENSIIAGIPAKLISQRK